MKFNHKDFHEYHEEVRAFWRDAVNTPEISNVTEAVLAYAKKLYDCKYKETLEPAVICRYKNINNGSRI